VATDDELFEIGRRAYGMRPADYKNKLEGLAAERRALYEAGEKSGYRRGYFGCVQDLRAHEAARIVADKLGAPMSDVEEALAVLADHLRDGTPPKK
jgi:hypothetical protein